MTEQRTARNAKVPKVHWNAKNKVWIGAYHDANGKRKNKWFSGKLYPRDREIDAQGAFLDFLRNEGSKSTPKEETRSNTPKKTDPTLALLLPMWLDLRRGKVEDTAENTMHAYAWSVNNWILDHPDCPHYRIEHLGLIHEAIPQDFVLWLQSLRKSEQADNSINQHLNTLRRFFKDAVVQGWLPQNFVSPLASPLFLDELEAMAKAFSRRRKEQHIAFFPAPMVQAFFSRPLVSKRYGPVGDNRRVRDLLCYLTGCRDRECAGLIFSDLFLDGLQTPEGINFPPHVHIQRQLVKKGSHPMVDFLSLASKGKSREQLAELPNATIKPPKYESKRRIPLHPFLVKVLRWWKESGFREHTGEDPKDHHPLFPHGLGWKGRPEGTSPIDFIAPESAELLRKDLQRLGLPEEQNGTRFTYHHLRHTFSTLLEAEGVSHAEVGRLLGHGANSSTASAHYIGKTLQHDRTLIARLPCPDKLTLSRMTIERSKTARRTQAA